ncbi:peptidase U32 family protein [Noviherbaspirillum sp. Root189]|uniref:peptidase U32 family protein n=1 Tax=Noviherbaspirillum sp. Root189 TaxID=1736487 RepID=UPI00138EE11C|nr:U32 family peptidase [Noviherbaspirillum sp. Root189]
MTKAYSKVETTEGRSQAHGSRLGLHCPVASLAGLRAAVNNGADGILLDFDQPSSLRSHCAGHDQFQALARGIRYAAEQQVDTVLAIKACHLDASWSLARLAIDTAADLRMDAVAMSDPALMLYTAARYPDLQQHYTVPPSGVSAEAIGFLCKQIDISRLVLPRMASLSQVKRVAEYTGINVELVGFGPLCNIIDNLKPAFGLRDNEAVDWHSSPEAAYLDFAALNASGGRCALDETPSNDHYYLDIGNADASALRLLPRLSDAGVRVLRIEAHVHSPVKLGQATKVWREAIDHCLEDREGYTVRMAWVERLSHLSPVLRVCHEG